jgi:hypothetical protein
MDSMHDDTTEANRPPRALLLAVKEILSSRPLFARPTQHSCVTKKNEDDDDYLFH